MLVRSSRAFRVEPWGPRIRWRRLTNRSLLRTWLRILIMSHAHSSSRIFRAYCQYQPLPNRVDRPRKRKAYLLHWNTSREQLDQIARFENSRRVKRFSRRLDRHATFDQVQGTGDTKLFQRSRDHRPCFLQVYFAVFREQGSKGRFFGEAASEVIIGLEWLLLSQDLPVSKKKEKNTKKKVLQALDSRTFHLSMSSVSHGFSFLYVEGILRPCW